MPNFVLPPSQFNGAVFVSTYNAVYDQRLVPSIHLSHAHPFHKLWRKHLSDLTHPGGLYDAVIDSFIAIMLGNPSWKLMSNESGISETQSRMRFLISQTPPNLIVVNEFMLYGCHVRCPSLWNFICISKNFVEKWNDADESSAEMLSLTAILLTSIHHGMGHWIQTIYSFNYVPSSNTSSDDDSSDDSSISFDDSFLTSSSAVVTGQPIEKVNKTLKLLNAPWSTADSNYGEAGYFVEVSTRGGIMQYSKDFKRAYLVCGPDDRRLLPNSYLKAYMQNKGPTSLLRFDHPPGSKSEVKRMVQSHLKTKTVNSLYFPFNGADDCHGVDLDCQFPSFSEPCHGYIPNDVLKL